MRRATMLFDADCGLCTHAAAWLMRRAAPERLRAVPLQVVEVVAANRNDAPGDDDLAQVRQEVEGRDLRATLHLATADGELRTGAAAVLHATRQVPGWRHLARLADHRLGHALLEPAYRVVAANRNRIGRWLGIEQACTVPGATLR